MTAESLLILGLGLGVVGSLLAFACLLPTLRWSWLVEDEQPTVPDTFPAVWVTPPVRVFDWDVDVDWGDVA